MDATTPSRILSVPTMATMERVADASPVRREFTPQAKSARASVSHSSSGDTAAAVPARGSAFSGDPSDGNEVRAANSLTPSTLDADFFL